MKRKVLLFITVLLSLQAFAQKVYDLDIAVENSADEISNILPFKSPTAVVKIFSDSQELSEYISDSLVLQLSKKSKLTMLERNEKKWLWWMSKLIFNIREVLMTNQWLKSDISWVLNI